MCKNIGVSSAVTASERFLHALMVATLLHPPQRENETSAAAAVVAVNLYSFCSCCGDHHQHHQERRRLLYVKGEKTFVVVFAICCRCD